MYVLSGELNTKGGTLGKQIGGASLATECSVFLIPVNKISVEESAMVKW